MANAQHKDMPVSKKHADEQYVSRSLRNFQQMVDAGE